MHPRFRLQEKLATTTTERETLESPRENGDAIFFMNRTTFDPFPIPRQVLGITACFLHLGMRLPVETIGERAIGLVLP
jgi:translation elongation factor P/translation initiation factor 5A